MDNSKILEVVKNKKYSICSCGASKSLPYCNNEHRKLNKLKNTNYKSVKIVTDKNTKLNITCSNWTKE